MNQTSSVHVYYCLCCERLLLCVRTYCSTTVLFAKQVTHAETVKLLVDITKLQCSARRFLEVPVTLSADWVQKTFLIFVNHGISSAKENQIKVKLLAYSREKFILEHSIPYSVFGLQDIQS